MNYFYIQFQLVNKIGSVVNSLWNQNISNSKLLSKFLGREKEDTDKKEKKREWGKEGRKRERVVVCHLVLSELGSEINSTFLRVRRVYNLNVQNSC